ncbi:MAG: zinc ABC transporter substrate-binding protein [Candidatus Methylophosphatis roskildensis]
MLAALAAWPAQAALNVLATVPELAALAQEIGGDKVIVASATTAAQDPHRIEARPSLIARARNADLVIATGAELEIGWLPVLQRESGNARIQPGRPGYFEAARFVTLIEKPAVLDRSQGDVHADGNPHLHLDPRNIAAVADVLAARLAELDAANAAHYAARLKDFRSRWQAAVTRWQTQAAPLKGVSVVEHHKNWSYLLHWLDMRSAFTLEPKPGVEPSVAHLGEVLARQKSEPAKMVLYTNYQSPRASQWLAERAGIKAVQLPFTVGASEAARDLFGLYDDILARLLGALK